MTLASLEPFARAVVIALAAGAAGSLLLAGAAWLWIRSFAPSATTRHALWWIALATSALLPAATLTGSLARIEHTRAMTPLRYVAGQNPPASLRPTQDAREPERTRGGVAIVPAHSQRQPAHALVPAETPRLPFAVPAYLGLALVALWVAIALLRLLALAQGFVALRALTQAARPLDDDVRRKLRRWRLTSRFGRPVRLLVSDAIDIPVAVGFRRPSILIPLRVARGDTADLDQIALHEYAHLERYDDWTNLAERAIACIVWFDPTAAFIVRRIALEREIACDDWVVARTGRAQRYAACLWQLVETARFSTRGLVAPGALFSSAELVTRIERLLGSRGNAAPRLAPGGALGIAALATATVLLGTARAPAIAVVDPADAQPQLASTTAPPLSPAAPKLPAAPLPAAARIPATLPSPAPVALHSPRPRALAPQPHPPRSLVARHRAVIRVAERATPAALARALSAATSRRRTLALGDVEVRQSAGDAGDGVTLGSDVARAVGAALGRTALAERDAVAAERRAVAAERRVSTAGNDGEHLAPFHRVRLVTNAHVVVRHAARPRVEVGGYASSKVTSAIVADDTLTIATTGLGADCTIVVEAPDIDDVEVDSDGNVTLDVPDIPRLALAMNGSGTLAARGRAGDVVATLAGSGTLDLRALHARTMQIVEEGSGLADVGAPATLALRVAGDGTIRLHGRARVESSQIDGSGRIERLSP